MLGRRCIEVYISVLDITEKKSKDFLAEKRHSQMGELVLFNENKNGSTCLHEEVLKYGTRWLPIVIQLN